MLWVSWLIYGEQEFVIPVTSICWLCFAISETCYTVLSLIELQTGNPRLHSQIHKPGPPPKSQIRFYANVFPLVSALVASCKHFFWHWNFLPYTSHWHHAPLLPHLLLLAHFAIHSVCLAAGFCLFIVSRWQTQTSFEQLSSSQRDFYYLGPSAYPVSSSWALWWVLYTQQLETTVATGLGSGK